MGTTLVYPNGSWDARMHRNTLPVEADIWGNILRWVAVLQNCKCYKILAHSYLFVDWVNSGW